jgi:hypothetical protein
MTDTAQAVALDPNAIGDDYDGETELDEPVDDEQGG